MKHIRPTYCEQFYCTGESLSRPLSGTIGYDLDQSGRRVL